MASGIAHGAAEDLSICRALSLIRIRIGCALRRAGACLALSGCDEKLLELTGPTPEPAADLLQHPEPEIFQSSDSSGRTACVDCHTARRPAGGVLNLSADGRLRDLVNVAARLKPGAMRVIPGDPDNSYLIHKLEGRSRHRRPAHAAERPALSDRGPDPGHPPWIRNGARTTRAQGVLTLIRQLHRSAS